MRQLHPYLADIIHRLLERGEETVYILLVRIDAVPRFIFGFQIECPASFVVLNHFHLVKPDFVRPFDSRGHIKCGQFLHGPVFQPRQRDHLFGKIAIIGVVAQGTVRIEEAYLFDAFLL